MVSRFLEFKTEINEYLLEHYNHIDFKKIINGVNTHEKLQIFTRDEIFILNQYMEILEVINDTTLLSSDR